jgi:hypothetical protein
MKTHPYLFAIVLLTVLFSSCKDEVKNNPPPSGGGGGTQEPTDTTGASKNLLGSTVFTTGSDVYTTTYRYDAQNRLVWVSNIANVQGYFEDTSKIVWDNNGHISKIVYSSDTSRKFADPKLDSVVYNVVYNTGTSRYTHKTVQYKSFNTSFKDSVAYTYDGTRITKEDLYYYDFTSAKNYVRYGTHNYTYNANGDLLKQNTVYYNLAGYNSDYPYEISYTYDDKTSLLGLGNEAIVIGLQQDVTPRNFKTLVATYPLSPHYNVSYAYTYTYNTKYRPLKADITDAVTGTKSTLVYTYQ